MLCIATTDDQWLVWSAHCSGI